jgi:hypothetical protein
VLVVVLAMMAFGCGGGSSNPTAPSVVVPTPAPTAPSAFAGRVTDTLTGAPVFGYDATIAGGRLLVSAPGYVPRDTSASVSAVDLIPEASFDVEFYRMFARGSLDGALQPLRVLRQAPSFFMEVEGARGLSQRVAEDLEQVARRVVPQLTGGTFQVTRWETGPSPRPRQNGWIVIERRDLAPGICGTAFVGATAGQILLDNDTTCSLLGVFAHELGHAFGFWHVDVKTSMMSPRATTNNVADAPTELERRHAAIAYKRVPGNLDIDVDP